MFIIIYLLGMITWIADYSLTSSASLTDCAYVGHYSVYYMKCKLWMWNVTQCVTICT